LDKNYPREQRNKVKEIYLNKPGLEGELDLEDFVHSLYDIKIYISTCVDETKITIKNLPPYAEIIKCVNAQEYINESSPETQ